VYRGRSVCGALCLLLLTVAASVIAPAALTASGGARRDPNDTAGPLDLARLTLDQAGPRMKLFARTRGRWNPRSLDARPNLTADQPQSYLCLDLRQDGVLRRACVGKKEGGRLHLTMLRIDGRGGVVSGHRLRHVTVRRPTHRSIRAVGRFRDLKLTVGHLGWRWRSGWGSGRCVPSRGARHAESPRRERLPQLPLPPPPPPSGGDPPPREPREPPDCEDRYPERHPARGRVQRPRIVGCTTDQDTVNAKGSRRRKRVALTFDDGPSSYTGRVLEILHRYQVNSTFFVVGDNIPGRASALRRMIRERHEIGNHTLHHHFPPSHRDLATTSARIENASGFRPCEYRPPGGARSRSAESDAWKLGMSTIIWDVDPNDWRRPGSGAIYSRVVSATRPGSIVLMHDGGGDRSQTVTALPAIIGNLKRRGYELVTVSRLLHEHPIWRP
jgi:peptidoglycan/xylan/chitin deacetylase (PgdA/CDA1 family)